LSHAPPHEQDADLAALRLKRLRRPGAARPLDGFDVLDLSCGDGARCAAALELGAASVTGIDRDEAALAAARAHCPEGRFSAGSWWDVPDRAFDLIFFVGAMHLEPRPKPFFDRLATHLNPGGTLIVDCNVVSGGGTAAFWRTGPGHPGRRHAVQDHLFNTVLAGYAARIATRRGGGRDGAVSHFVLHCTPRLSAALLLTGPSGSGKTVLARQFRGNGIPAYSVDGLLARLIARPPRGSGEQASLGALHEQEFTRAKLDEVARFIEDGDFVAEFARLIGEECPVEAPVFAIEGEALRYPTIQRAVQKELGSRGVIAWKLEKCEPSGGETP
jgi:SAM-dependent methyltransferase